VEENSFIRDHRIMLHPRARGTIKFIAPAGDYTLNVTDLFLLLLLLFIIIIYLFIYLLIYLFI
jgi:hypothetical protein